MSRKFERAAEPEHCSVEVTGTTEAMIWPGLIWSPTLTSGWSEMLFLLSASEVDRTRGRAGALQCRSDRHDRGNDLARPDMVADLDQRLERDALLAQRERSCPLVCLALELEPLGGEPTDEPVTARHSARPGDTPAEAFASAFGFLTDHSVLGKSLPQCHDRNELNQRVGFPVDRPFPGLAADRKGNDIALGKPLVPTALRVGERVGHADFQLGLGASFDAGATVQAEEVWNTEPFDLNALPNLVIHRAAFQFDGLVPLPLKLFENSPSTDGPYGELLEETLVSFE